MANPPVTGEAGQLPRNLTDNMPAIYNMYLFRSYVTEMGQQLNDLEDAQLEYDSTVAALEARSDAFQSQIGTLEARNDTLKTHNNTLRSRNDALQAQLDQLQAQLHALQAEKEAANPNISALSRPELLEHLQSVFEHLQSVVQESRKFFVPGQTTEGDSDQTKMDQSGNLVSDVTSGMQTEQEKQDVDMTGTAASSHTPDNDANDTQPSPKTPHKPKDKSQASAPSPAPAASTAPSPSKSHAAGSPRKGQTKQSKGSVPGFMGTTAAAAARSRPPISKTAGRPETPTGQTGGTGQPAPATREEIHTGDRRRLGHIPNISPHSPSATPSKKQRKSARKSAAKKSAATKGRAKR